MPPESLPRVIESSTSRSGCMKWTAILILGMCLILAAVFGLIFYYFLNTANHLLTDAVRIDREKIFDRLSATLGTTPLQQFVLAERKSRETVKRTDRQIVTLWHVPFVSQAVHEVDYTANGLYGVSGDRSMWRVEQEGAVLYIWAPGLVSLRAAVNTASIRARTESGWFVFGEAESREQMFRALSDDAQMRAGSPEALAAVRETARQALVNLIYGWLSPGHPIRAIQIRFADEEDFPIPRDGAVLLPDAPSPSL